MSDKTTAERAMLAALFSPAMPGTLHDSRGHFLPAPGIAHTMATSRAGHALADVLAGVDAVCEWYRHERELSGPIIPDIDGLTSARQRLMGAIAEMEP